MRQEWLNIWMDLSEATRGRNTSYVVPVFHKRGIRGGGILIKYGNNQSNKSQSNHTEKRESIIMVAFNVPSIKVVIHLRIKN